MQHKNLYCATVNGENSLTNKRAKTYVWATSNHAAIYKIWRRYLKLYGKASVTELFMKTKNGQFKKIRG